MDQWTDVDPGRLFYTAEERAWKRRQEEHQASICAEGIVRGHDEAPAPAILDAGQRRCPVCGRIHIPLADHYLRCPACRKHHP